MAGAPSVSILITARTLTGEIPPALAALCANPSRPAPVDLFLVGRLAAPLADHEAGDLTGVTLVVNHNLAAARNVALQAARGDIICFIDADCTPAPDWVSALLAPFADPTIAAVKGSFRTGQRAPVARFLQLEYETKYDRLRRQKWLDFVDLYSAAYRRDILIANGGFDEQIAFLDDRELAFRLSARGYRFAFHPPAAVWHEHHATLRAYSAAKFATGYWKAQIVRRFPQQGIADSHTPQLLKLQMVLLMLLLPALLLLPFWPAAAWGALLLAIGLAASTLPTFARAWRSDRALLPYIAPMLLVRAAALSAGYTVGTLRPQPGISGEQTTIGGLNYVAKRLLDVAGGLVGSLLTLLLLPPIALAIKLDSAGPVFFRQERIGQRGRPFRMIKFRTMVADAEAQLADLIDLDALAAQPAFKLHDDPRVTRVGRFLRRWSLDELPQFWNVLRGEMSLVGPRPEESRIVALYNDWQRRRLAVKPGLSGPMQVNGRGDLPLNERVRLEIDYIENYSLWRDLQILFKTFPTIIEGSGAR